MPHLHLCVLASGSAGNATYIGDGVHGVVIDCGLSTRQIVQRMRALGLDGPGPLGAPVDAVLITHDHGDHIGSAAVLDRKLSGEGVEPVPFYMTPGTRRGALPRCVPRNVLYCEADEPFEVGALTVEPLAISHDTREPVAFLISGHGARIGVITDLGVVTSSVERAFSSLDAVVLEFNHDPQMLAEGPYTEALKARVRGDRGHLSNGQAAALVTRAGLRLKHLVLAHLSEHNNTEAHARRAADTALGRIGRRDIAVHVGHAERPLRVEVVPPAQVAPLHRPVAVQQSLFGAAYAK